MNTRKCGVGEVQWVPPDALRDKEQLDHLEDRFLVVKARRIYPHLGVFPANVGVAAPFSG